MMTSKKRIGVLLGTAAAATLLATSTALAYLGDPSVQGPNFTDDRHEAMENAFENNDYITWAELMGDRGRVTEVVNQGNFSRFAEAHELAGNGDLDGARAIRAELGLGLNNGQGKGRGNGLGMRDGSGSGNGPRDGTGARGQNGNCIYAD
jgi:hypothetical protein